MHACVCVRARARACLSVCICVCLHLFWDMVRADPVAVVHVAGPQSPDSEEQQQRLGYDFAQQELMEKELGNDPIQEAIGAIEKQHEEDKQGQCLFLSLLSSFTDTIISWVILTHWHKNKQKHSSLWWRMWLAHGPWPCLPMPD